MWRAVVGDEFLHRRALLGNVRDVERHRNRPLQPAILNKFFRATGELDADCLGAGGIEGGRDGGAEISGAAGDPDGFVLE